MQEIEKEAIRQLGIIGMDYETILKLYQEAMPSSTVLALVRGAFAGFMRDILDAANSGDLKILAKYWMLASSGANPIKDGATKEQIEAMERFKEHVKQILGENEEIHWPEFDEI